MCKQFFYHHYCVPKPSFNIICYAGVVAFIAALNYVHKIVVGEFHGDDLMGNVLPLNNRFYKNLGYFDRLSMTNFY